MVGGFILGGTTASPIIVRTIGPSLIANGFGDAQLDRTLEVYDGNGVLVANDNYWRTNQEAEILASTISTPTDDREVAVVSTLASGAYSA